MSDRKYIILRKQPHEPTQPPTYVELGVFGSGEYCSAKSALREALKQTEWPEARQSPEGEYLVVEDKSYSRDRLTVSAHVEYDVEKVEDEVAEAPRASTRGRCPWRGRPPRRTKEIDRWA